jgi:hypothetical protein
MADEQRWWRIEFYTTRTGHKPMRAFLDSLTGKHDDQAVAMMRRLQREGSAIPIARPIETGLFELKGFQVRIYFVYRPGRRIILLDGDVKKQDKISQDVLKRIRGYRRDFENREAEGS